MTRDDLRMEKGQKEVHYAYANVHVNAAGCKTARSITVQAPTASELEAKLAALPDQLRNQYENPGVVSVEVKTFHRAYMTREEFEDYIRRDNIDTEREMDKFTL